MSDLREAVAFLARDRVRNIASRSLNVRGGRRMMN
jgi:hypothetical protein